MEPAQCTGPDLVSPLDFAREPEPDVALPGLLRRATALPGIAFGRRLTLARPSSANRLPPSRTFRAESVAFESLVLVRAPIALWAGLPEVNLERRLTR
jgi:hypothetical protein